jgi:hypothetical protein
VACEGRFPSEGLPDQQPVTMNGGSSVTGNSAGDLGGGIFNSGTLAGAVAGRNVRGNTPDNADSFCRTGALVRPNEGPTR